MTSLILKIAGRKEFEGLLFSAAKVSEKPKVSQNTLIRANIKLIVAAAEKGCIPKKTRFESDQSHCEANQPIAGPSTKPRPKAIPTMAIPFDLSFLGVTSAIAAVATEILPPAIPPMIRENRSTQKSPAMIHKK